MAIAAIAYFCAAELLARVQTVDGRLDVRSPRGGPTIITIELPRHA